VKSYIYYYLLLLPLLAFGITTRVLPVRGVICHRTATTISRDLYVWPILGEYEQGVLGITIRAYFRLNSSIQIHTVATFINYYYTN